MGIGITQYVNNQFEPKGITSGLFGLSSNQTSSISVGDQIAFADAIKNNGIEFNSTTNQWTLKKGKRYKLGAMTSIGTSTTTSILGCQFYDVTNGAYLNTMSGYSNALSYSYNGFNQPNAIAEVTPETDIVIELRISANTAVTSINKDTTWAYIQEIQATENPNTYPFLINAGTYDISSYVSDSNLTIYEASATFYRDLNDNWFADFDIIGIYSSAVTEINQVISCLTFKNVATTPIGFAITICNNAGGSGRAYADPNTSTVSGRNITSATHISLSGKRVPLDSKPTIL